MKSITISVLVAVAGALGRGLLRPILILKRPQPLRWGSSRRFPRTDASMPGSDIRIGFSSERLPACISVGHGIGMLRPICKSPLDVAAGFHRRAQAQIASDGCIYAGLGFSDGAVARTSVGYYLCKSHHWDRRLSEIATHWAADTL